MEEATRAENSTLSSHGLDTQWDDFAQLLKAAELGNVDAQFTLGWCYYIGEGVEVNLYEAVKWYRKAAEQGDAKAQCNLGWCYNTGKGVERDMAEAAKWYRKSAEQGDADAQYNLSCCYARGEGVLQDMNEALKWCRKAADQGEPCAQNRLGWCYDTGEGVERNVVEAAKWFRRAAEQGHEVAQYNLARCYENGEGVPTDKAEAASWSRKAAEQGYMYAQCNLGLCYANGDGVEQDKVEAVKWYRKAAEQGDAKAQCNLGVCYGNGEGVERDAHEAVKWFRAAAEQGHVYAQYNLGVGYAKGDGVPQDVSEAAKWYGKAAEQGYEAAKAALKELLSANKCAPLLTPKGDIAMSTKKTAKKIKNVLIISASFRPNSNSHALCQEVAKGVKAAGNQAEVIRLRDKKIGFCTGCYACQKLGKCVIQDDANAIVEKICKADAVVFGTPVYYFSIAGQLKALFDRCVAKWPEPNGKPYYLVATMAENMDWDLVKAPPQGFVDCFEGAKIKGFLKAGGVYEPGAVKKTKFMKAAFDLGKKI